MATTVDTPRAELPIDHATPPVAVVTGASRGLGAGIADAFARAGYAIGACARNRPELPAGTVAGLTASVDVRDADAVGAFAASVTDDLGPIELWINNAGVLDPIGPLRAAPVEALEIHVQVNLLGVLWGTRVFAGNVHDRDEPGTLVNITSGAAGSVYEGWSVYCATKAAVDQLTRVVAAEESRHGLTAWAVAPGVVDTDMQALIRSTPPDRFPSVDRFHELQSAGALSSPEWVGARILDLHRAARSGATPAWARTADPVVMRVPPES